MAPAHVRSRRRIFALTLLAAMVAVLALAGVASADFWTPESGGSPQAESIDTLYKIILAVAAVVFFGVEGVLLYSFIKFRARPNAVPAQIRGNTRLEIGWTAGAALLLVVMVLVGVSFWGPIPAGCLWIGSRFNYWTDSVIVGRITRSAGTVLVCRRSPRRVAPPTAEGCQRGDRWGVTAVTAREPAAAAESRAPAVLRQQPGDQRRARADARQPRRARRSDRARAAPPGRAVHDNAGDRDLPQHRGTGRGEHHRLPHAEPPGRGVEIAPQKNYWPRITRIDTNEEGEEERTLL
ncbi:MAG: hypothetical protein KY463_13040, partial [Actinobacteria bacterium]|nr:hypothetical protein [Actinomycetota bacterium]